VDPRDVRTGNWVLKITGQIETHNHILNTGQFRLMILLYVCKCLLSCQNNNINFRKKWL